jgi:hypothetical protein
MTLDYLNPMQGPMQRSKRWRMTIVWSAVTLVALPLLVLFLMPPQLGRSREAANRIKCAFNLRQIGQAALLYANDHAGQWPGDLPTILETQDISAEVFTCASSDVDKATGATTQQVVASLLAGKHISYAWIAGGLSTSAPADVILAFELEHHVPSGSATTTGINVLLNDGSVTFVNEATANAIWAQFVSGVRPIRLSTSSTPVTTLPASSASPASSANSIAVRALHRSLLRARVAGEGVVGGGETNPAVQH